MAGALRRIDERQLDLYDPEPYRRPIHSRVARRRPITPLCAGCRAKEARYGFRDEEGLDRPRTLCFECFRLEILRRHAIASPAAQIELPLADTLHGLDLRRRRAQIAARRALGIRSLELQQRRALARGPLDRKLSHRTRNTARPEARGICGPARIRESSEADTGTVDAPLTIGVAAAGYSSVSCAGCFAQVCQKTFERARFLVLGGSRPSACYDRR